MQDYLSTSLEVCITLKQDQTRHCSMIIGCHLVTTEANSICEKFMDKKVYPGNYIDTLYIELLPECVFLKSSAVKWVILTDMCPQFKFLKKRDGIVL